MKKFTTILMTCLIMLVVVLTGCSTFSINKVKYYNEILAKVGEENITRFDLITAYNNYGYSNYVTQGGQTEKEALNSTMTTLVSRKLLVKHAMDNPDKYSLSEYEIKNLYRDTLDYLLESMATNKETARKIYDLEEKADSITDSESKESIKFSEYGYQKRVQVVNGQIQYRDIDTEKDDDEISSPIDERYVTDFASYTTADIVNALRTQFLKEFYTNTEKENASLYRKVCDKALELSCNNLINYEYYLRDENGNKLSKTQDGLIYRFVERAYESHLESAYITKINTEYLKNETLTNESIINAFKAMYESDYAKYANDADAYASKIVSTGTSSAEMIYYTPDSDNEFGYFLHVLLPFNNVEDELTWLKERRDEYDVEDYKYWQGYYIDQIMCAERTIAEVRGENNELIEEEGIVLESQKSIQDVLAEYRDEVRDLESFKQFMFKYTTDTATLTADMPYVIGYNTKTYTGQVDSNGSLVGAHTTMVTNFTKEAIRLIQQNQAYTNYDEYILTNYGIHLLYYVAPVENKIDFEDINKITVSQLDSITLNEATGETYLDRVFDLVYPANSDGMFTSNTKYSSYEQILVDSLYAEYQVVLYTTKINASNKI